MPDCNRIVEVERPRTVRVDASSLEACFREDKYLRCDGDVERFQNRREIAGCRVIVELLRTVRELRLQTCHRIPVPEIAIADRRMIAGQNEGAFETREYLREGRRPRHDRKSQRHQVVTQ